MKVGFVGLGLMGLGMARNILKSGQFELMVTTRTQGKAEKFAEAEGCKSGTLKQVAEHADVICLCVTDSPDVQKVALGPDGLLDNARKGTIIVDMSTISPDVTRDLAEAAKASGVHWLDGPVSGGTKGADNGSLTVFLGGEEAAVQKALPVLQTMAKTVTHFGSAGKGQSAKLTNQILGAANLLGLCEAFCFAQKSGLDLEKVRSACMGGAANSWALDVLGGAILEDNYDPAFMVRLQNKDLRLVLDACSSMKVSAPCTSLVLQLLQAVEAEGRAEDGTQSLVRIMRRLSGMKETTK